MLFYKSVKFGKDILTGQFKLKKTSDYSIISSVAAILFFRLAQKTIPAFSLGCSRSPPNLV